jgi:hypothetical protein
LEVVVNYSPVFTKLDQKAIWGMRGGRVAFSRTRTLLDYMRLARL